MVRKYFLFAKLNIKLSLLVTTLFHVEHMNQLVSKRVCKEGNLLTTEVNLSAAGFDKYLVTYAEWVAASVQCCSPVQ